MEILDQILSMLNASLTGGELPTALTVLDSDYMIVWVNTNGRFEKQPISNLGGNPTIAPLILGAVPSATNTTTDTEIQNFINQTGFNIVANSIKILQLVIYKNGKAYKRRMFYKPNAIGTYGTSVSNEIDIADFYVFIDEPIEEDDDQSVIIQLGDIGSSTIHAYINATNPPVDDSWDLQDDEVYIFKCIINGFDKSYLYTGVQPQLIGNGANSVDADDFFDLSNNSFLYNELAVKEKEDFTGTPLTDTGTRGISINYEGTKIKELIFSTSFSPHASEYSSDASSHKVVLVNVTQGITKRATLVSVGVASGSYYKAVLDISGTYTIDHADFNVNDVVLVDFEEGGSGTVDLSGYQQTSEKGQADGYAGLDGSGKVPAAQLPSYVDDSIEGYLDSNVFYEEDTLTTVIPAETGKVYVDLTGGANKSYRYTGSVYTRIDDISASEVETLYNSQVSEATQAEAEEGTSTDVKRWSPERVKQAIEALGGSSGGGKFVDGVDPLDAVYNDGNVGILTTDPQAPLDVNGMALIDGANLGTQGSINNAIFGVGARPTSSPTTGITAIGYEACATYARIQTVAVGWRALKSNNGNYTVGIGSQTGANSVGQFNSFMGYATGINNNGQYNNGFGYNALANNTGNNCNGFGTRALERNDADGCTAFGVNSLRYVSSLASNLTAVGYNASVGSISVKQPYNNSTALGANSALDADNQVVLGDTNTEEIKTTGAAKIGDFLQLTPITAAPSSPSAGMIYFDATLGKLRCYANGIWNDLF